MTALLSAALLCDNLDDAVRPIQEALGITDGGVAALAFSGLPDGDDSWPKLSPDERREWLCRWLAIEIASAEPVLDDGDAVGQMMGENR